LQTPTRAGLRVIRRRDENATACSSRTAGEGSLKVEAALGAGLFATKCLTRTLLELFGPSSVIGFLRRPFEALGEGGHERSSVFGTESERFGEKFSGALGHGSNSSLPGRFWQVVECSRAQGGGR
jgi:hypothetical protein